MLEGPASVLLAAEGLRHLGQAELPSDGDDKATQNAPSVASEALDRPAESAVLHRHLGRSFPKIAFAKGCYLFLDDGRKIFDGSGGASVACIGHGNERVNKAMNAQMSRVSYCLTTFYTTSVQEELCRTLVQSTNGCMSRAYIVSSGSEAMEAALKLARQTFLEKQPPEPQRSRFISRRQSYHGITLGALAVGGHATRRAKFEPLLSNNVAQVSPCNALRGKKQDETDQQYVTRLAQELDDAFQRLGPETVCAFVAEPVVGAAMGCVPAVSGYFAAVKAVCDRYGALLILDEVMCGMGRTGTLHAWEQEGVVPDLQTVGKGLGAGYQPIAAVLVHRRVADILQKGSSVFVHGHTFQGHPVACAAALEVQHIVQDEDLLTNVREMGSLLWKLLRHRLSAHENVGNIRGRGLFWGIEFVRDKTSLSPFPAQDQIALAMAEMALMKPYCVSVYPGTGSATGVTGDHIILSPPYNVTRLEIEQLVSTVVRVIEDFFAVAAKSGQIRELRP